MLAVLTLMGWADVFGSPQRQPFVVCPGRSRDGLILMDD